jgi:integrase/recombinase XerD
MATATRTREDCVPSIGNPKKLAIAQLVRTARAERFTSDEFLYVVQQARKKLKLTKPKRSKKLPQILSEHDLQRFWDAIQKCANPQHEIMLKLLFVTGIRVSELVDIRVEDVDAAASKIFIRQGKGSKDRYVLFPDSFRLVLTSHLRANPRNRWLFETQRKSQFTPRRVQQIVQSYARKSGLAQHIHPHLFRHQLLTFLTSKGLSDAQIQLISGHATKVSLEVYQHLSLESVDDAYQAAARELKI